MLPLNVLIGCACSPFERDAFIALGHNAWSCDLKPSEGRQGNHLQGDVRWALDGALHKFPNARDIRTGYAPMFRKWDLAIFHPECTYLCNSGVKWCYKGGQKKNGWDWERDALRIKAEKFWQEPEEGAVGIPHVAFENPIPHLYAKETMGDYSQIIQPWQFGHKEMKATCLWLWGLPDLVPTDVVGPPPKDPALRKHWAKVHRASPGPNRSADRARTLPGIAAAMAQQWGRYAQLNCV